MSSPPSEVIVPDISRSDFPENFIFGAATSAYQVEGAASLDGKGPSSWDVFSVQTPEHIKDGSNGNVAVDQYHRYKEDVALMKKIGLDAYRFSISWSRVLPGGRLSAGVNKEGVQYYNNLIDELLKNGIEPYVTLFHWDIPQALEAEYGGFLDRKIIDDFRDYADFCFWEFGDRVKNWITLNEPWTYAVNGYAGGGMPPNRGIPPQKYGSLRYGNDEVPKNRGYRFGATNDTSGDGGREPYIVTHNLILAHGKAVEQYRKKYKCQRGKIGMTIVSQWWIPLDDTSANDEEACLRMADFFFGWYMAPITYGEYPKRMRDFVKDRLPEFTEEESEMITMSYDFLGLNYYTARYAQDTSKQTPSVISYNTDPRVNTLVRGLNGELLGPMAGSDWLCVYPPGMYDLLKYVQAEYNDPLIYITENGYDKVNDHTLTLPKVREDPERISYICDHLQQVKRAMDEKVNVAGYFHWSFIDNYEWQEGYSVRYGMIYVDYRNDLARYPKWSAIWYMNFLDKGNVKGLPAPEPVKTVAPAGTKRPNSGDADESAGQKQSKRKVNYRV